MMKRIYIILILSLSILIPIGASSYAANVFVSSYKQNTLAYSTSMTPNCDSGSWFIITATDGVAFAINAPTNVTLTGQEIKITIKNTSGGALGVNTPNAIFKLGAAWPSPANGKNQTMTFTYDGTNWIETGRTAGDVSN